MMSSSMNATQGNQIDLVFAMDATGSMSQYIRAAKNAIAGITSALAGNNIKTRFGLVAYRDHKQGSSDSGYVTKTFPWTEDASAMEEQLASDHLEATGGGDGPEAVEAGMAEVLQYDWNPNATKMCVLIADAPPHGLGENGDFFPEGAPTGVDPIMLANEFATKGIAVYAIACEPTLSRAYGYASAFFADLANRTNGRCVALTKADTIKELIVGGALEEVAVDSLMGKFKDLETKVRSEKPDATEAEIEDAVHEAMVKDESIDATPSLAAWDVVSPYGHAIGGHANLAEARAALAKATPDEDSKAVFSAGGASEEWELVEPAGGGSEAKYRSKGADRTELSASEGVTYSRPSKGTVRKMMGKGGAGSRGYYARSESKPYAHPTRDARGRFARSA